MGYQSPRAGRMGKERQIIFGDAGVGKSDAILCIAKRLPEVRFRILEIDWAPSAALLLDSERFAGVTNVEVQWAYPDEWKDQEAGLEWLQKETGPDDWAAVDSATHTWPAVQEWFIERMFPGAGGADEYFMSKREQHGGEGRDLRGWEDWPYIKKEHNKLYKAMARIQGHVILTAEQAALGESGEKKDDRALFARFGYRPAGRKQLAHAGVTVAHLSRDTSGQQYLTTFKDRGRELVGGAPVSDYFKDYMVKVAGWKFAGDES
jgi:hypothetical protein